MNKTVVIVLISVFGMIVLPIITYYLTSRGTTKKTELEKQTIEMILKINEQPKNDLEKNEKEIEKANKLESNFFMNEKATDFIPKALERPNNDLSKELNAVITKDFLTNKK